MIRTARRADGATFAARGVEAVAAENGSNGVQAAKAGQIDLVIMDVGLPDIDGREAVRILRRSGFKAPIIMLTGHDTDSDTILGLESGANDYVTKPSACRAACAHPHPASPARDERGRGVHDRPIHVRPSSKLLLNPKGSKVRLTEKETSILRYLYRAGQRPVSRETLCRRSGATTRESPRTRSNAHLSITAKDREGCRRSGHLVTEAGGYKLVP